MVARIYWGSDNLIMPVNHNREGKFWEQFEYDIFCHGSFVSLLKILRQTIFENVEKFYPCY